jgi:hypothetical protein
MSVSYITNHTKKSCQALYDTVELGHCISSRWFQFVWLEETPTDIYITYFFIILTDSYTVPVVAYGTKFNWRIVQTGINVHISHGI